MNHLVDNVAGGDFLARVVGHGVADHWLGGFSTSRCGRS